MSWTCPRCSAANFDGERHCRHCAARLPFAPPAEPQQPEPDEAFVVPRRGELTAALRLGLESWRSGELATDELAARLRRATSNVPTVFAALCEQLGGDGAYVQGVLVSLSDCQALFESGLGEMLQGLATGDDFHVRFGWLLAEKGEEEYIRILETLRRDAAAGPFTGQPDSVGKLAAARERGEIDADGMRQALDGLEEYLSRVLGQSLDEIRQGLQSARSFDGLDPSPVNQARERLRQAAQNLAEALLTVA